MPLPERAARVLELAALQDPGAAEAKELAQWSDPRATDYFFRSGPAPAWLNVLQEHAGHLLMPDGAAGGRWPAAPFLEHVADADPAAACAWLTELAGKDPAAARRVGTVAAAGRYAVDALLGLADAAGTSSTPPPSCVRFSPCPVSGTGVVRGWARSVPRAERTGQWIPVVEELLADAVEDEYTGHLALRAVAERVAAGTGDTVTENVADAAVEEELRELIAEEAAARLPDHDVAMLVRELACTAYPAGRRGPAHRNVGAIRAVLAKLFARDVELTPEASRPIVFGADLDRVRVADTAAFGGPRLARAVLDVAAADADAGTGLAQRTRQFRQVARVAPGSTAASSPRTSPTARPPPTPWGSSSGGRRRSRSSSNWWPLAPTRSRPASSNWCCAPARPSRPRNSRRTPARPWARCRPPTWSTRCCPTEPTRSTGPSSRSPPGCGSGTLVAGAARRGPGRLGAGPGGGAPAQACDVPVRCRWAGVSDGMSGRGVSAGRC